MRTNKNLLLQQYEKCCKKVYGYNITLKIIINIVKGDNLISQKKNLLKLVSICNNIYIYIYILNLLSKNFTSNIKSFNIDLEASYYKNAFQYKSN